MSKTIKIGTEIRKELNRQERTVAWLASKLIKSDSSNLRKKIELNNFKCDELYEISVALKKDFFAIYSHHLLSEENES